MNILGRLVPASLSTRLAKHAVPLLVGTGGTLLVAIIAALALLSPGALGISAARLSDTTVVGDVVARGLTERDSDLDGLSDSLENYVYGTDPANWDSAGLGIPDGWLVQFGFDPLDPLTRDARGRPPPADTLPAAYAHGYPVEYTPSLRDYYAYAKPSDHRPGVDAPWWRRGEHADPVAPDQTGTGIPTGWLLHHGVPLTDLQPDRVAPGSVGNLTIRQAFEHDTDPLERDSDRDGIDDWVEIHVTRTDPSRFDTAGHGIADGWLLHHKLDAFDPRVATQDPDRDGLTNYEEFLISVNATNGDVAATYTRGLNPREWQTAQTGIPDGWYVKYGLSPFGGDVDRVIGRASDFPEYRSWVPEGAAPLPDVTFTVRGAYEYARPSDWNESVKGVWWGGTNPVTLDSDGDGLTDPVEIRGWYANVTFDTGPEAKPRAYLATGNPLEPDSDGDGLTDLEEYRGRVECKKGTTREFPPTDPRNRDTAFSGLSDHEKVCGVPRDEAVYDVGLKASGGLDPTRADSAGDHLKDGPRLDFWHARAAALRASARYPYPQSSYATLFEWTEKYTRFAGLTPEQTLAQFRPDGDADGDGIINVADADPSGGLYAEKFDAPGTPKTKIYFLGGPQIDPSAYRLTEFASPVPHPATDPANPDTDGDSLPDAWEIRYGKFDPARGLWDLDPTKRDSDADGITDDKANNDADVVTWYAYDRRGASTERTTHQFAFTNELEFLAGTDPNTVSTAGDGVPDGWKAFWGSRVSSGTYPNLVGSRDASIGSVAIDRAADIEAALARTPIATDRNLRGVSGADVEDFPPRDGKITGYVRLVNVTSCDASVLAGLANTGERVADTNACFQGTNLETQPIRIARFYGALKLTYADEARLRTNPYLADSDGDGAPDAYEVHFGVRLPSGALHPDPAIDEGARDADGDGLGIRDECGSTDGKKCGLETFRYQDLTLGAGADPNLGDSDHDGVQDGIETSAGGLNPLDPSDIASFARADLDSDGDGLPDFVELTGKDSRSFFGETIRTNPKDPDTDGDGLLDGEKRNLHPVNDAALIAAWNARGIAHRVQPNGTIDYLGERIPAFGVRPDKLDSRSPGVPDGWIVYHGLDSTRAVEPASYNARKPDWWKEPVHGVWWWGDRPGQPAHVDADGDGLNDANGEDPFPASLRLNRIVDAAGDITNPEDVGTWVAAAGNASAQRLRAQRVGDGAGDPEAARTAAQSIVDASANVHARDLRACVALIDVAVPRVIEKGVAFNVTGRLVLNERTSGVCGTGGGPLLDGDGTQRVGVANRTVLASVFSADRARVIGAGFTSANGTFNLSVNVTASQRYAIPAPGLPLLGSIDGVATARFDPALLATGNQTGTETNRIVVWVYNSSAAAQPGEPTRGAFKARLADRTGVIIDRTVNATRFAHSAPFPITVQSGTRIEVAVGANAENGDPLNGTIKLTDASGAALIDKTIVVRWEGSTPPVELRNLTTDRDGLINLTRVGLRVAVPAADDRVLTATFLSNDPNLLGSERTHAVAIRNPTRVHASSDAAAFTVGDAITITGQVVRRDVTLPGGTLVPGGPVAEGPVKVTLGGVEATERTDASGQFSVQIVLPGSLPAGTQSLAIAFLGTQEDAPSQLSVPVDVKRTSRLVDLTRLEGPRSAEVALRGRLVDNEGQGFGGPVEIHHDRAGLLARGIAANDGGLFIVVPFRALELGSQSLRVVFPGDLGHAPTQNITLARVTSATRLVLEGVPETVVRGTNFPVRAVLRDDEGTPVVGQPIAGFWRGERLEVKVSGPDGAATFIVATNLTERPATTNFGAEYTPTANSVYQGTSAGAAVRVVQGARLALDDVTVARGPIQIHGTLVDDEGRPLPGSLLTISLDGVRIGEARTARNGSFELAHRLADATPLGPHRVAVRFAGTSVLQNATVEATWHVRSPLTIDIITLGPFVRGEPAPLDATLRDDLGVPVDTSVRVFLGGFDLGQATSTQGKIKTALKVPADIARGPTTLRIQSAQTPAYDALDLDIPVVVKIRPKVEVELPTLAIRGFSVGGVVTLVDDKGEPLRNTSFAYAIGSASGAVVGQTNAEGKGSLASVAPLGGDATLALTVRGGDDVLPAQFTTKSMRVVGPATPVGYAALAVAALVLVGVIGLVVAAVLLRRRQLQEARDILDEAIRDLLAGNEYAGTIFLAYRRFAAYLSRHGFAEKASDTPREFATGVRKALPIGAVPLRALIGLFEEARYSDHPIGSSERDRAVASLAEVRNELDRILGEKKVTA